MRVVCYEFIDLAIGLFIDNNYEEHILCISRHLLKLESKWTVADIFNLIKNGILLFHTQQNIFHRYLTTICNFALSPGLILRSRNITLREILESRDEEKWKLIDDEVATDEEPKTVDQIFEEMNEDQVDKQEQDSIKSIIESSRYITNFDGNSIEKKIEQLVKQISSTKLKDFGHQTTVACLSITSMALYSCKHYWPTNAQLVSYCLLVHREYEGKGRLLEILTGEGKSSVIAMVAASFALLGHSVDIVTSSPVLSQRDVQEWRSFYNLLGLRVGCNIEDMSEEEVCYECNIVYGTVGTFARDILKTEFHLEDVRKGRKYGIVIVDEVDSMLIDHGVQCTYLSDNNVGMRHLEPVLAMIWMVVSRYHFFVDKNANVFLGIGSRSVFCHLITYLQ